MSVEKKTGLYFLYNNDEDLNEADPLMSGEDTNTAFALKDDDTESWCVCEIKSFGSFNLPQDLSFGPFRLPQDSDTQSDPRDFMKSSRAGNFHMFKLRTDLTLSQKTAVKSIIDACSFEEGWPVSAITEMESHGFLNGEQKAEAIENRRNSANIPYNRSHSQTNGEQTAEAIEDRRNSANIPYNRPHSQTNGA
jgi:hypothetical protein